MSDKQYVGDEIMTGYIVRNTEVAPDVGTVLSEDSGELVIAAKEGLPITFTKTVPTLYRTLYNLNNGDMYTDALASSLYTPKSSQLDVCLFFKDGCFWLSSGLCYTEEESIKDVEKRVAAFRALWAI